MRVRAETARTCVAPRLPLLAAALIVLLSARPDRLFAADEPTAGAVTFSTARGFYTTPFDVTFTAPPGASIRYTLDGTTPTATAGTPYAAPVPVKGTTVLRAVAYRPGHAPGPVTTHTYLFPADVRTQTVPSPKHPAAAYPPAWKDASAPADYNVDAADIPPADAAAFAAGLVDPAVPSISIVTAPANLFDPATGIYQNPTAEGGEWERPVSIEFIDPAKGPGFQVDAGLRVQGGMSRVPANQPKHAFRALFKKKYGPGKLSFPLFGDRTGDLHTIVFRSTYNNSWTHWDPAQHQRADYVRDAFARLTQRDMGHPAVRQRYAHLYLNGLYWGLYDLTDRPADAWAAVVVGGKRDHYTIVNSGEPVSGPPTKADPKGTNRAAADWRALFEAVRKDMTVPANYHDVVTRLVDPTNLADYMVQQFFAGNLDWDFHNYYAYRDTDPAAKVKGWRFVAWDSERTLEGLDDNVTGVNTAGHPTEVFRRLMANPDFKLLFADRAHRALANDGPLTPAKNIARYKALADQIQNAVVAESARWGDFRGGPYTRATWRAEVNRLTTTYFPARTDRVAKQFAAAGFTPAVAAPLFAPHGGKVTAGHRLTITPPAGTVVHYTTDGTDPRVGATATTAGGAISPTARAYDPANRPTVTASTPVKARARSAKGQWSALTEATFVIEPAPAK